MNIFEFVLLQLLFLLLALWSGVFGGRRSAGVGLVMTMCNLALAQVLLVKHFVLPWIPGSETWDANGVNFIGFFISLVALVAYSWIWVIAVGIRSKNPRNKISRWVEEHVFGFPVRQEDQGTGS